MVKSRAIIRQQLASTGTTRMSRLLQHHLSWVSSLLLFLSVHTLLLNQKECYYHLGCNAFVFQNTISSQTSPKLYDSSSFLGGDQSVETTRRRRIYHTTHRIRSRTESLIRTYAKNNDNDDEANNNSSSNERGNNKDKEKDKSTPPQKKKRSTPPPKNKGKQQQQKSKAKSPAKQEQSKPKKTSTITASSSKNSNGKNKNKPKNKNANKKNVKPINNNSNSKNKNKNKNKNNNQNKNDDAKNDANKNILNILSNPYEAGKSLRQTLDSALTSLGSNLISPTSEKQRQIYYLDDKFLENSSSNIFTNSNDITRGALEFAKRSTAETNPLLAAAAVAANNNGEYDDGYVPEVLVIGATGEIGRLVVRRLIRDGRFRVRVLVRDLYSKTLNLLGTGVTYCQGDLNNVESLEYAVTDVDKIVFCAGAPKRDEEDFRRKFEEFAEETLRKNDDDSTSATSTTTTTKEGKGEKSGDEEDSIPKEDEDLQRMSNLIEVRAQLAEQVDLIGMQNLVRAYQNVRHADYGTSQAAKRSLFKFQGREEDFNLFSIEVEEDDNDDYYGTSSTNDAYGDYPEFDESLYDLDNPGMDLDDDYYDSSSNYNKVEKKQVRSPQAKAQVNWKKNKFNHGVFVGRVPFTASAKAGNRDNEASVVSSRLRSREAPESGIDLSNGFAGFVCRLCSDGKRYEAFIRTSQYESEGIEYVCQFKTGSKRKQAGGNKSVNKFVTVRLPFSKFTPVKRRQKAKEGQESLEGNDSIVFDGKDVQQIGFRFCSTQNQSTRQGLIHQIASKQKKERWINFYLALCYIKVYRSLPEPEFVYLSDARIPPVLENSMIRHDLRQILDLNGEIDAMEGGMGGMDGDVATIFDEKEAQRVLENPKDRSGEETYFKYRGEEILKHSGLSYAIVRIAGLNELPSGEFSTVRFQQSNRDLTAVSRAEVADVCVNALLNKDARNVCFYMTKAKPGKGTFDIDEQTSSQFITLKQDT